MYERMGLVPAQSGREAALTRNQKVRKRRGKLYEAPHSLHHRTVSNNADFLQRTWDIRFDRRTRSFSFLHHPEAGRAAGKYRKSCQPQDDHAPGRLESSSSRRGRRPRRKPNRSRCAERVGFARVRSRAGTLDVRRPDIRAELLPGEPPLRDLLDFESHSHRRPASSELPFRDCRFAYTDERAKRLNREVVGAAELSDGMIHRAHGFHTGHFLSTTKFPRRMTNEVSVLDTIPA